MTKHTSSLALTLVGKGGSVHDLESMIKTPNLSLVENTNLNTLNNQNHFYGKSNLSSNYTLCIANDLLRVEGNTWSNPGYN